MAESGGDDSENPFSFKKFVKKKDRTSSISDEDKDRDDTEDTFPLPDVSAPRRKEKTSLMVEDESQPVVNKKNPDENPFSFKKFLSGSQGGGTQKKASPRSRKNAPDFASDLPDFVQDHFVDDGKLKKDRGHRNQDLDLPDFALTSNYEPTGNYPSGNGELYNAGDLPDVGTNGPDSIDNGGHVLNEDGDNLIVRSRVCSSISSLPDFLPDGAINNTESFNGHNGTGSDSLLHSVQPHGLPQRTPRALEIHGDLELENRRLREENQKLKQVVEDTKKMAVKESERVSELLKRMEKQQKKEAEETAVMERAVQQVEANLVTTTQRAVKAENTVAKLKQEVKTLQNKVSALQTEKQTCNTEDGLSAIKERTKYASEQLAAAADAGEQTIKQLLTGVDKLRLLSQVLESIDRINDVTDNPSGEGGSST